MNGSFKVVVRRRDYMAMSTGILLSHVASLALFLVGAAPAFKVNHDQDRALWISVTVGVIVGSMFLAFVLALNAIWIAVSANRWVGVLGEQHYEISPEGLVNRHAAGSSLIRWSALKKTTVFRSGFAIHQTSWLIFLVPRATYTGTLSFDDACAEIRNRIERAAKQI